MFDLALRIGMSSPKAAPKRRRNSEANAVPEDFNTSSGKPARDRRKVAKATQAPRNQTLSFDHLVESADYNVNDKYESWSCTRQFNVSYKVVSGIEDSVKHICKKCTEEGATLATRINGVKACVEIGAVVTCTSPDQLGREVRKSFQVRGDIEDTIMAISESFTASEREMIWDTLGDRIEEVYQEASGYCTLPGLGDVIDFLSGEADNDDESG